MAKIVPTVGRNVLYTLSESDVRDILLGMGRDGYCGCGGPVIGDIVPAMVVKTWGNTPESCVNLHVLLDGPGTYWATSRFAADEPRPGYFHWMDYQKGQAKKTEELELILSVDASAIKGAQAV